MGLELFRLDGKTAWVTGGARGLGREMAEALASAGAALIVTSRSAASAEAAARDLAGRHKIRALGLGADVTRAEDVRSVVERAEREFGGIDILVNNAGINVRKPTVELSPEEWNSVLETNLTGAFVCTKATAPGMIRKRWGRIIHVSSILGLVGVAGRPAYAASKGGLILLARTQALELAPHGVTVNALCPGPFPTDMNKPLLEDPAKYRDFAARIPLGRWGELSEIHGAVIFLASPAASFVTGIALPVDGGWTAQ
ncbi:MAG TPA: 3-oxoacyl-ACP reductase family protein [Planctomycetota bacterium]|nr:3-oxoacyl-ACP reductase family protein [Planctomycetota bacterium]